MSVLTSTTKFGRRVAIELRAIPFSLSMILITVLLGLASGLSARETIGVFNDGFGDVLGEIALVLLPSFVLASAITHGGMQTSAAWLANGVAPFAGAAMLCPDTAYAALAPVSGRRKLSTLFGVYAGFKLLVPAGPALVASMLGGLSSTLIAWGAAACLLSWAVGVAFARRYEAADTHEATEAAGAIPAAVFAPFLLLLALIILGSVIGAVGLSAPPFIAYLLDPKGALLMAAILALAFVRADQRADVIEKGVRRTTPLLLMIGAASALGAMMAATLPFAAIAQALASTGLATLALFLLAAALKLSKGSSMATFAGAGGIVAALLPGLGLSAEAATLALCAGAFVAIAPNDSLFWLARDDIFAGKDTGRAARILATGSTLQGLSALAVVQGAVWAGWL